MNDNRDLRLRLQELAWRVLRVAVAAPPERPVRAEASDGATRLVITATRATDGAAGDVEDLTALLLGPLELLVVQTIGGGKLTAKAIAKRSNQVDSSGNPSAKLRCALSLLAERGVLAVDEDLGGYTVNPVLRLPGVGNDLGVEKET